MKKKMVLLAALTTAWCLAGCKGSTGETAAGNGFAAVSEAAEVAKGDARGDARKARRRGDCNGKRQGGSICRGSRG